MSSGMCKKIRNVTHQLLVYPDDVNMLGEDINGTKKNTEALLQVGRKP
jgi:hypothetical protein